MWENAFVDAQSQRRTAGLLQDVLQKSITECTACRTLTQQKTTPGVTLVSKDQHCLYCSKSAPMCKTLLAVRAETRSPVNNM